MTEYIEINCLDYIDRVLKLHNWQDMHDTGPIAPLPEDSVTKMYAEVLGESGGGPHEGTSEHAILEKKLGFSYRSVLGELMYAYVTCRPDIGMLLQPFLSFQHFLLNIITPVYEVSFNISVVQRSGEFDIIVHVVLRNFIPIWNLAISRMNHLLSPTTFRGFHPLIHKP